MKSHGIRVKEMENPKNIRDLDQEILKTEHQIEISQLNAKQSTDLIEHELKHPERFVLSWIQDRLAEKARSSNSIVATFLSSLLRFV